MKFNWKRYDVVTQEISFQSQNGFNLGDAMSLLLEEFIEGKKQNKSLARERVWVKTIVENIEDTEFGQNYECVYEVIGETTGELHLTVDIKVNELKSKIVPFPDTYKCLLQLAYSGCYATPEDEQKLVEIMELNKE